MRIITIALLSSFFVACSTQSHHKKESRRNTLVRGSTITFEKRFSLKKNEKQKAKSLALVRTAPAVSKSAPGRSIASTCSMVKFCKLNAMNLRSQTAEIYGEYSILTPGKYNSPALKSWTLVNGSGQELQLICGVLPESKDKSCKAQVSRVQIKDIVPFIENLMQVKVAAAQ